MTIRYAQKNAAGLNLGTEDDPFTTIGAALAISVDGDCVRLAGDGTEAAFDEQIQLDPWHELAVTQWPGRPQAHVDFASGLGGFDQATVYKRVGWGAGVLEISGLHLWNSAAPDNDAFCSVLRECNAAGQRVIWDNIVRQGHAIRGAMFIEIQDGTWLIRGGVRDALGEMTSGNRGGRCFYCTGQSGGTVLVEGFFVDNCDTDDWAFYTSVQTGGTFTADRITVEQKGMGQAIAMWLKAAGITRFTRGIAKIRHMGPGATVGIEVLDSDSFFGETIFERMEVDAAQNDPTINRQTGILVAGSPGATFRNCTIMGDYAGVVAISGPFGFLPSGMHALTLQNSIIMSRRDGWQLYGERTPGIGFTEEATSIDGNVYYSFLHSSIADRTPFRIFWVNRNYTDLRRWRDYSRTLRFDHQSIHHDPRLLSPLTGRFELKSDSPCIDSALLLDLLTTEDRKGQQATHINPHSICRFGMSAIDIGALEYNGVRGVGGSQKRSRYGVPEYGLRRDGGTYVRGWNL